MGRFMGKALVMIFARYYLLISIIVTAKVNGASSSSNEISNKNNFQKLASSSLLYINDRGTNTNNDNSLPIHNSLSMQQLYAKNPSTSSLSPPSLFPLKSMTSVFSRSSLSSILHSANRNNNENVEKNEDGRAHCTSHFLHLRGGSGDTKLAAKVTLTDDKQLNKSRSKQSILMTLHQTSFLIVASSSMVAFLPLPSIARRLSVAASIASVDSPAAVTPQTRAIQIISILSSISATLELLLSPLLGIGIDAFGRKMPYVACLAWITVVNMLVMLHPSILSLCTSRMTNVLSSGFLIILANSIIGDLFASNDKNVKGKNDKDQMGGVLGRQAASVAMGFLFGTLLGGRLVERGERVAYSCSSVFSFLALMNASWRLVDTLNYNSASGNDVGAKEAKKSAPGLTLASKNRNNNNKNMDDERISTFKRIIMVPFVSSFRLLFHYGSHMRFLAILLMLQSIPIHMGDVFQMFAKEEWGFTPKDFGNLVALFGILGIIANTTLQPLLQMFGLRTFSLLATLSSTVFPLTVLLFPSPSHTSTATHPPTPLLYIAACFGMYAVANKVGTSATITSLGNDLGIKQGQLQGEKASLLAIIKIISPVLYGILYLIGKEWKKRLVELTTVLEGENGVSVGWMVRLMGTIGRKLPFVVNVVLAILAFALCWKEL